MSWLNDLLPWLGLGGASLLGILAYVSGLSGILRVGAAVLEALVPILKTAIELTMDFLKWVLPKIADAMWEGLKDTVDSMKTIIFVMTLVGAAATTGWHWARQDYNQLHNEHVELIQLFNQCKAKLPKGTKITLPKPKAGGNGWFPGLPWQTNGWPF